jgi:ubiquinone/menaquinone biosynthesis C-methylase UbiE
MSADISSDNQKLFVEEWQVYRKMVDNDYLFHRGAYDQLNRFLIEEMKQPFSFLDVACGDASMTVKALHGTTVAHYVGLDISQQALDIARDTLAGLKCRVSLKQQDFIEALQVWNEPVDVVWIGLSLHHLQGSGKLAVMQNVRRLVGTAGWFLVYENASPDGETRDAWLERWDEQKSAWTAYSTAEWDYVTAHVHAADFPETSSKWHELGREAGFSSVQELFVSPTDLFRLYAFSNYQKS